MRNEVERSVSVLLDNYRSAVLAKDVETLVAMYDRDVCVFDMWSDWSCEGIGALRGLISRWFGSLGENRDVIEFERVCIYGENDRATVHAFIIFKCVAPDGKELRSMQERLTWSLFRADGAWRIVHQHTSAPVDFNTFKIIFKR